MNAHPQSDQHASVHPLQGTLAGVRVLDFSQIAAGPLCTMILGDMWADVVKVEPPEGDVARRLGPPFVNGESTLFLALNRNKRSLVLDLKTAEARQRVEALAAGADVLVESFRPGVADRLGIGFATMRTLNPKLIYCSISAYGQDGPWRAKPGVDGVLQAVSGLMSITGAEGEPPSKLQTPVVDMITGYHAAIAVLAGLRQRDGGIVPGRLDVSLFAGAVMLQQIPLAGYLMSGELPIRSGSGAPYATPNEAYETADGHILVAAYQEERWRRFCGAIDRVDLADDPRFAVLSERMAHRQELTEEINATFRRRDTAAWIDVLEQADVICAPVADYRTLVSNPQFDAAGLVTTLSHTDLGLIPMPGFAIGGRPPLARRSPPDLGAHADICWEV